MASQATPAEGTAADLWNQRSILNGLFLGAVGYGVQVTLAIMAARLLFARQKTRSDYTFLAYLSIISIIGGIANATNIKSAEMTFIDNTNYPGGPSAYFVQQSSNAVVVLCNSISIVGSWFQDGLMLYRFWMIFSRNYYVSLIPALMFATSVGLSCVVIAELCTPNQTFWTQITINLAIPYWSISIALNIILTLLIAGRLLLMRRRLIQTIPNGGIASPYVSLSAMLIESAFIYSVNAVIFLVSYAVNSPIQNLALPLLCQTQVIAPLLIIVRVAQGRAWTRDTYSATFTGNTTGGTRGLHSASYDTSTTVARTSQITDKVPSYPSDISLDNTKETEGSSVFRMGRMRSRLNESNVVV
ncbi:hypothetical protein PLICRDRAFT_176971 [Plicaturopsis crispa FD-325 SS-3]|nr:hypothetical protein PLICRDRAFT_176971 [Plicaturopsis crispa FD-325 SS-3]